jgi:hypothetical protein
MQVNRKEIRLLYKIFFFSPLYSCLAIAHFRATNLLKNGDTGKLWQVEQAESLSTIDLGGRSERPG